MDNILLNGVEIMFNKDIKLKPSSYGQYDREFYVNDFKTVEGLESVENSIIISLMTRLGELNHNPPYNNFGCGITPITKNSNTLFKTGLNPQRHGTSTIPLYQTFTVPYGTTPGTYNTTITYTAIKTGTNT